jgi:hypothetical protein
MPSEGSVLIESCKQSVGVEIRAALHVSHLDDDWDAVQRSPDFARRSLLVQTLGDGENVFLYRGKNDGTEGRA